MKLTIPELCLVALIGPSGCGKSTFARKHFRPTEVVSSDRCRALVADDEDDQSATSDAFELLNQIASRRLAHGRLTVIDATSVQPWTRKPLIELAKAYHVPPIAVVLNLPEKLCLERAAARSERPIEPAVIRAQKQQLRASIRDLREEGFRTVYVLETPAEIDAVRFERQPLRSDLRGEHGPFDIIGDVHGCFDELSSLLGRLGYRISVDDASAGSGSHVPGPGAPDDADRHVLGHGVPDDADRHVLGHGVPAGFVSQTSPDGVPAGSGPRASGDRGPTGYGFRVVPPPGRKAVFLGDLVDRGPGIAQVLRLVMSMVAQGAALCVPGNHDLKLLRWLSGRKVNPTHGLAASIAQLEQETPAFRQAVAGFIDGLVHHYVLDDGRLVVAHAGMKEAYQGRSSGKVREFALYGETTGESDEYGLPVRIDWAADYRGRAMVVYGHTPVASPAWVHNTVCVDTGCVFGGRLTALRYPERELVSVPAAREYYPSAKPLGPPAATAAQAASTTGSGSTKITPAGSATPVIAEPAEAVTGTAPGTAEASGPEPSGLTALEAAGLLELRQLSTRFLHTIAFREESAAGALEALRRSDVDPGWLIYLPPGMTPAETASVPGYLEHPVGAFEYFWKQGVSHLVHEVLHPGPRAVLVVCRDEDVARRRFGIAGPGIGVCYGRSGRRLIADAGLEADLLADTAAAMERTGLWDALDTDWICLDGVLRSESGPRSTGPSPHAQLAPFHLMAGRGQVFTRRDHGWHLETVARLAEASSGRLVPTPWGAIDLEELGSGQAVADRWEACTAAGGGDIVFKPLDFLMFSKTGLVQPALECRGRERLRAVYGPDYDRPENLERLRSRGLSARRGVVMKQLALGLEGLERFVRHDPPHRVRECVFGVLALELEPVGPPP